jgi:hypothetical protein
MFFSLQLAYEKQISAAGKWDVESCRESDKVNTMTGHVGNRLFKNMDTNAVVSDYCVAMTETGL